MNRDPVENLTGNINIYEALHMLDGELKLKSDFSFYILFTYDAELKMRGTADCGLQEAGEFVLC